jgi:hypothetical protein
MLTEAASRATSCRPAAGAIRPLESGDVARVAELHEQVMPKAGLPPGELREQLARLLLWHPWRTDAIPSLVYEDDDGRVVGCIGVMPRPMLLGGRPITAAISHSFIVEPGSRALLVALKLAQAYLAGPQDLSLAEGSAASRRIWESAGGSVSLLYGLGWTRPLQPGRYVLSFLRRRGLGRALEWALAPACRLIDAIAPLASRSFRLAPPADAGEELDAETLCTCVARFSQGRSLRPRYEAGACRWLIETLAGKAGRGHLYRVVVRDAAHEPVGWYLYYLAGGGSAAVVQVGAKEGCGGRVLDHLCHHARAHGAIAVAGQVDPALFQALASRDCLFHHDGGSWFLVHSRHADVLQAIHRGDAFLTRLEAEWWISTLLS